MANGTTGRLDYIIQRADQNADRGYQLENAAANRASQERMQQRALRQQAVLGGINAAVNVGQLGLGVANYMQRSDQIAKQEEDSQVSELLAGGLASSKIAGDVMAIGRQKDQFDLSVTRGNERMLQNVSTDAENMILERINSNDPEALSEGLRRKIVSYPPHVESELRSVNARIAQIQVDDSYSPQARQRAISVLQNKQATLQWQVAPNPGRPMTASERGQMDLGVIADPNDASKKYKVYYDRSGALREFIPDEEKTQRKIQGDMMLAEHKAKVESLYKGDGGKNDKSKIDEDIGVVREQIRSSKQADAESKLAQAQKEEDTNAKAGGRTARKLELSDIGIGSTEPTEDEIVNHMLVNRRVAMRLEQEVQRLRDTPYALNGVAAVGMPPSNIVSMPQGSSPNEPVRPNWQGSGTGATRPAWGNGPVVSPSGETVAENSANSQLLPEPQATAEQVPPGRAAIATDSPSMRASSMSRQPIPADAAPPTNKAVKKLPSQGLQADRAAVRTAYPVISQIHELASSTGDNDLTTKANEYSDVFVAMKNGVIGKEEGIKLAKQKAEELAKDPRIQALNFIEEVRQKYGNNIDKIDSLTRSRITKAKAILKGKPNAVAGPSGMGGSGNQPGNTTGRSQEYYDPASGY